MKTVTVFKKIICPTTKKNPRNSEADIIEFKDGSLLLAYSDFEGFGDHTFGRISGKLSRDGGHTWGRKFTLQANDGRWNVMLASFLRLRSGKVCLFYGRKNSFDDLKIYLKTSSDEGRFWSEPVCATLYPGYMQLTNNGAIQLDSGRILIPVSHSPHVEKVDHFKCFTFFSDDDGKTWKRGKTEIDLAKRGADEPKVIELKDGRVMMLIRNQLGRIYRSYSSDAGETWAEPKSMVLVSSESPVGIGRIPKTGDLLIIWNHVFSLTGAHHCGGRCPLTAAISQNEGETWENIKDIETDKEYDYAYPSITFVGERVLLTYYVGDDKKQRWSLKLAGMDVKWFYRE